MKRNRKSVLALLLALCMAMSLLCTSVWAAEEDTPVPDESAAAEVVEVQDEEDASAEDESAPEDEEPAPAAEAEDEAPAEEPELEAQDDDYPNYQPKSVTADMDGSKIALTIQHGTRPMPVKGGEIVVEGKDVTAGGSYQSCQSRDLGNDWQYGLSTTSYKSDDGSWGSLALVSGHTYQFQVYYTYPDGRKGESTESNEITYGSASQDQASIQERITKYLTVGLDSSEGEDRVYPAYYDGLIMTPNETALLYNRPLYQLELDYTGTSAGDNGDTLLNFHAVCNSRVPGTSDAEGLEFRMEGIYFINRQGEEQYQALAGYDTKEDFTVSLNELGYGCNYVRPKMICYGYDDYDGVEQYYEDEPFCFGMYPSSTPLSQYSALTTKDTITLKHCTNYGGTLSYDSALPSYKGNVSESGVTIWYRKKGASSWTKKKFKGTSIPKISGLKADTVYQWKAESYLVSKDPYGEPHTLTGPETKVFTVCTAVKAKPQVKSCKVSGATVSTHTIPAHWDDVGSKLVWREKQVWYTTDFKVTYTFKNPSKNIKGYTSGGVYSAVKGGKVTFKMSVNTGKSKKKAKKFSTKLQSCTNTNGPGYEVTGLSPTLKYSGKIK